MHYKVLRENKPTHFFLHVLLTPKHGQAQFQGVFIQWHSIKQRSPYIYRPASTICKHSLSAVFVNCSSTLARYIVGDAARLYLSDTHWLPKPTMTQLEIGHPGDLFEHSGKNIWFTIRNCCSFVNFRTYISWCSRSIIISQSVLGFHAQDQTLPPAVKTLCHMIGQVFHEWMWKRSHLEQVACQY